MKSQRKHIVYVLKINYRYVIKYEQNCYITDIIGQFVALNRRAIKEPKEVFTLYLCQ